MKCPFFKRKTSSYRFSGIKCEAYNTLFTLGNGHTDFDCWSEEVRNKHFKQYCNCNYKECHYFKTKMIGIK